MPELPCHHRKIREAKHADRRSADQIHLPAPDAVFDSGMLTNERQEAASHRTSFAPEKTSSKRDERDPIVS
jgi:hypothetical protein